MLTYIIRIPFLLLLISSSIHASPLDKDEKVIFFPTSAQQLAKGECEFLIHAWVFEQKSNSLSVKFGIKTIGEIMEQVGLSDEQVNSQTFRERLSWFLVDNESNKELQIRLNKQLYDLAPTSANGHSSTRITSRCKSQNKNKDLINYQLRMPTNDNRVFQGQALIIPNKGVSVISDIDDTIKISLVLDKKALIQNTFVDPFKVAPGMPEFYQQLKSKGTYFHYVSASPWQLYPSLTTFMNQHYPIGSFSLRYFRVKDSSFVNFLKSSKDYKLKAIRTIIQQFPNHRFILVGDNGEHDPEIYQHIAKEYPKKIESIYIRSVTEKKPPSDSFKLIMKNNAISWKFFTHPDEIPSTQ